MKVSVIIPTYNGAGRISDLLESLVGQTVRDFEVIVVIDGSTDNTIEVLEKSKNRFPFFKIVEQANGGRSQVRNRGAAEASGDLLIFYDDDMVPFPDSVERHIRMHQTDMLLVAGNPIEQQDAMKTDIQNYKAWLTERWKEKYVNEVTRLTTENLFFTAANCSIYKSLFVKLGGFDERLADAEDYDFGVRALSGGYTIIFDKANKATHNDFITARSYVTRLRQYQVAHRKLKILYPTLMTLNRKSTIFYKRWIYRIFSKASWLQRIDNRNLEFISKNIRYRLYGFILHSLAVEYPNVKV